MLVLDVLLLDQQGSIVIVHGTFQRILQGGQIGFQLTDNRIVVPRIHLQAGLLQQGVVEHADLVPDAHVRYFRIDGDQPRIVFRLFFQILLQVFNGLDLQLQLPQILLVIDAVLIFFREGGGQVRQDVGLLFQLFNGQVIFSHFLADDSQALPDEFVRLPAARVFLLQGRLIVKMDDAVQDVLRLHRIVAAHGNIDQVILSICLFDGQSASQSHRRIPDGGFPDNHGDVQCGFTEPRRFLHDERQGVEAHFLAEGSRFLPLAVLFILLQPEFRLRKGNHAEPGAASPSCVNCTAMGES